MGWKEDYGGYWIRSFLSRDRDQDPGSGVRWGREDGQPGGKGQDSVESSHRHKRGPDPGSLVQAKLSLTPVFTHSPHASIGKSRPTCKMDPGSDHRCHHPDPSHQHLSLGLLHTSQGPPYFSPSSLPSILSRAAIRTVYNVSQIM